MFNNQKVVVTMTSWAKRIGNCVNVIQSILENTVKPDIVFLNLSLEEFPNRLNDLPKDLVELSLKNSIVKFNWVSGKNTKTMKKVFPILDFLQDDDIILPIDDDILYPQEYISSRLSDFCRCKLPLSGTCNNSRMYKCDKVDLHYSLGAGSLFQKKMLLGYKEYLTDEIINSANDDTQYSILEYLNGYINHCVTKYDTRGCLTKQYIFNDVEPSHDNSTYLMTEQIYDLVQNSIKLNFNCKLQDAFGIRQKQVKHNICYITDDKYAEMTEYSLNTLIRCIKSNDSYDVYIICDSVSEEKKKNILRYETNQIKIILIDFDSNTLVDFKRNDMIQHVSNAALIKFNLPNILKSLDKVLYVDCDIIFIQEPLGIFRHNLDNFYLGGCPDDLDFIDETRWKKYSLMNKLDPVYLNYHNQVMLNGGVYINTGVLYMNLEKMRTDDLSNKLIQYKKDHQTYFVDQDTFNVVCLHNIYVLSPLFNSFRKYYQNQCNKNKLEKICPNFDISDIKMIHIAEKRGVDDKIKLMKSTYDLFNNNDGILLLDNKIPKIIHFAWFGSYEKLPKNYMWVIDNYKKMNPDFQIDFDVFTLDKIIKVVNDKINPIYTCYKKTLEWFVNSYNQTLDRISEPNIRISSFYNIFVKMSDFYRYEILSTTGGIWCDLDTFPLKPFDEKLLGNSKFVCTNPWGNNDIFFIGSNGRTPWFKTKADMEIKSPFSCRYKSQEERDRYNRLRYKFENENLTLSDNDIIDTDKDSYVFHFEERGYV